MTYHCPEPFEYLEITAKGDAYLCCNGRQRSPIGNIFQENLHNLWHGSRAEAIRESILNQTFSNCYPCAYLNHKAGRVVPLSSLSMTQRSKLRQGQWVVPDNHMGDLFPDPVLTPQRPQPRKLWLLIDDACQLRCPSCRKDFKPNGSTPYTSKLLLDLILRQLHEGALTPETLWVDGSGEATHSEAYANHFWPHVPELPQGIDVGLLTNAQNFTKWWPSQPPEVRARIRKIRVSVDGFEPLTYETNRYPSRFFQKLIKSLAKISELKRLGEIIEFRMIFAVQQNNFGQMAYFANWAYHLNATPWFTALTNWGTYTHEEYKARAIHLPTHPRYEEFQQYRREIKPMLERCGAIDYVMPPVAEVKP